MLKCLREASVNFPPTYKYKIGSRRFDGSRVPAWTDRIFQVDTNASQLRYRAHMGLCHTSDHRPVSALFRLNVDSSHQEKASSKSPGLPFASFTISPEDSAMDRSCKNSCGRAAYGRYSTCCTWCKGPDGPHASDCQSKAKV